MCMFLMKLDKRRICMECLLSRAALMQMDFERKPKVKLFVFMPYVYGGLEV